MTEVIMPKMGDGMEEGTLLEWLKQEGEAVKSGEVIGTIQTDKATMELEAPAKGFLAGVLIQAGATVPVGVPIAAVLKEGESLPAGWGGGSGSASAAAGAAGVTDGQDESLPVAAVAGQAASVDAPSAGRVKASPLAKRIAEEAGIDLGLVAGSGPGGRIVERDVREAIAAQGTRVAPPSALTEAPAVAEAEAAAAPQSAGVVAASSYIAAGAVASGEDVKIPLNRLRGIIAERTQHSKQTVPHFYVTVEVDLEKITQLREMFKAEDGGKISVNDFVVRAVTLALQEMPEVNATYMGDHILRHGSVNIGIAAAVDDGLLVPVIHGAHGLTLRQISEESKRLVKKARDGKLTPNEMQGSTFSISNMGMLDVDNFGAIINEPNAGIIAVSSARKKVVVGDDDEVEIRWRMNITGSFDHRVVDGAVGAQFMNRVRAALENPTRLLS